MNESNRTVTRKAVFLDRDGTLIEEVDFLSRVEDMRFFPYTDDCVRKLKEAGYLVIVVTNQSGVARGLFGETDVHAIHGAIQSSLTEKIDAFFHCPHMPDAGCACRKPGTGMIEQACTRWDIDLESSWMIGDKELDVLTGVNAGLKTCLVETGYGSSHAAGLSQQPDLVAATLEEAVRHILGE